MFSERSYHRRVTTLLLNIDCWLSKGLGVSYTAIWQQFVAVQMPLK